MSGVKRIFVEKKEPYAVRAAELKEEIASYLGIQKVTRVRVLVRYDIENVSEDIYKQACATVFSEPPLDELYEEEFPAAPNSYIFSVEYLPGQFDQRADSAEQCISLLNEEEKPVINTATTYVIEGSLLEEEYKSIKSFCINPVDSRETDLSKPETLVAHYEEPDDVIIFDGFIEKDEEELFSLYESLHLAMTKKDFLHIQNYFKNEEKRNSSMTEIRVLDTYWSDHCRHTTFSTELRTITLEDGYYRAPIEKSYQQYRNDRQELFAERKDKYICLMDLALIAMRKLKKDKKLIDLEESDEINACSIVVPVTIDGETEEWLISFKNETHNHPTEIEPFGGAATCLGGAIRDPLSGRSYVYQAMRITGAADPAVSLENTLRGKLPQRKIVTGAASGYSSYGNQIGLATGYVKEIYHPNYVAKRMEIGAVMGAAPRSNVIRETSDPGDVIVLLGGRTGRDGCGGATGSSKVHTEASIETCGAEVQKGNAPTERKIQRLFRREEVSRLIKKCNDFGAGGVSVAIGELADGLNIDLDKVPKKYAGLDGTEIAISESQERMAVVISPSEVEKFLSFAKEENLEATAVAKVTKEPRLVMTWRNTEIVNISRAFLDTNGAHQESGVTVTMPDEKQDYFKKTRKMTGKEAWLETLRNFNVCSQKGLVEMFDASIGAGSVFMPYGGKYQLTETQCMVAKLPLQKGETDTVTMMSYGFDPYLSSWSPYHGAVYAVLDSVVKIVAAGGNYKSIHFTFQEYFKRLNDDAKRWGEPFAALLGAYEAQMGLELASIGGKDSMSGTFEDIDVPPTLTSFAVNVAKQQDIITPELKKSGNVLVKFSVEKDAYHLPDYKQAKALFESIYQAIQNKTIVSAYVTDAYGVAAAVSKMAFGNRLGVAFSDEIKEEELYQVEMANIIAEVNPDQLSSLTTSYEILGTVIAEPEFRLKETVLTLNEAFDAWKGTLEDVFPTKSTDASKLVQTGVYEAKPVTIAKNKIAKPTVFIPVFPGTNCEYDSARAFENAGANVITKVFRNLSAEDIKDSIAVFEQAIAKSQIIMFPGGFSAGDEPEGSAKFFATAFRNEKMKEVIQSFLYQRDGLMLGICNGFQALIKLGLVSYGEIAEQASDSPTLAMNTIGRHISKMVYTKVVSNQSPWLAKAKLGETYVNPASHGEGRFVASKEWIEKLFANGQVATQYVDEKGNPTMDEEWNPNGSFYAVEGITSPDGRIFGKMAHAERRGSGVAINIYGEQDLKLFESGVAYFK